jgi:hypothetical protein
MSYPEPPHFEPPRQVRIGVWGPPESGKTTFLAALKIATMRNQVPGNWIMNGSDDDSTDFLIDLTDQLAERKVFPSSTFDPVGYVFRFTGEPAPRGGRFRPAAAASGGRSSGLFSSFRRGPDTAPLPAAVPAPRSDRVSFELDILDVPGTVYGRNQPEPEEFAGPAADTSGLSFGGDGPEPFSGPSRLDGRADVEERLLDHLQDCQGIVYLYDPVRDAKLGDTFLHFHRIMEKLARRVFEQDSFTGTRLPQHVAVCVTKFDSPEVYRMARRFGYSVQDAAPPYLPRVSNQHAYDFFVRLCQASGGNADLVVRAIPQHFANVGYFVTSAVGFYVGPNNRFQPHNGLNVVGNTIKGRVYPINVLEPILWLHDSLLRVR